VWHLLLVREELGRGRLFERRGERRDRVVVRPSLVHVADEEMRLQSDGHPFAITMQSKGSQSQCNQKVLSGNHLVPGEDGLVDRPFEIIHHLLALCKLEPHRSA